MSSTRSNAIRRTRLFQGVSVACALGAGAVIALPLRARLGPGDLTAVTSKPTTVLPTKGPEVPVEPVNTGKAALRLVAALGWKAPDATKVDQPTDTPANPEPPKPAPSDWVFAGSIISPSSRHAIIKLDNQQLLLREGEEHAGVRLVSVESGQITIESDKGVRKQVMLQDRASAWPTDPPRRPVAFRNPSVPNPVTGQPGQPGQPGVPGAINQPVPPAPGQAGGAPATFDALRNPQRPNTKTPPPPQPGTTAPNAVPHSGAQPGGAQMFTMENIEPARRDMLIKQLSDKGGNVASRTIALRQLGVVPGMDPRQVTKVLRLQGLDADADRQLGEVVRLSTGGTP